MKTYSDYYPDADKLSLLLESVLDVEAKKVVLNNMANGFDEAMEQLRLAYGRSTVVYSQLVEEFLTRSHYDYSLSLSLSHSLSLSIYTKLFIDITCDYNHQ